MLRLLVAFDGPDASVTTDEYERDWDQFVATRRGHGLQVVNDLDPVATTGTIEVYEAVRL